MAPGTPVQPTSFELRILKVLWAQGSLRAREVQEILEKREKRRLGYTTVLKMLQVMEQKGLVAVDRGSRSHVYAARSREKSTLRRLVSDFVDRTFEGQAEMMLLHLVREGGLDAETLGRLEGEIAALRRREKHDD